jgi:hypothetical protein
VTTVQNGVLVASHIDHFHNILGILHQTLQSLQRDGLARIFLSIGDHKDQSFGVRIGTHGLKIFQTAAKSVKQGGGTLGNILVWLKILHLFERTVLKKSSESGVEDMKTHRTRNTVWKIHFLVLEKLFQPTQDNLSSVHHASTLIEKDVQDNLVDLVIRIISCFRDDGSHLFFMVLVRM